MLERLKNPLAHRPIGALLIAIGSLSLAAPFVAGAWSLQLLALPICAVGVADVWQTVKSADHRFRPGAYLTGGLPLAAGLLLLVSPSLAVSGLVLLLMGLLGLDGATKVGRAIAGTSIAPRPVAVINGLASLALCFLVWMLWRRVDFSVAVGVAVGGYTVAAGWQLLLSPGARDTELPSEPTSVHPDPRLGLEPHELFKQTRERIASSAEPVRRTEYAWFAAVAALFFAIHLGRMQSGSTWLGLISPFVATAGDIGMTVAIGVFLLLPLRVLWRRLTRPIERAAWRVRINGGDADLQPLPRWTLSAWTESRFAFSMMLVAARRSLPAAMGLALRLGLPVTALFVAINPIWGFSWYFNTESWASGFYQKMTELRVDKWREGMVKAVAAAYGDQTDALFRVNPDGVDRQDFSFLVIGDPGEGDASQYALMERYLEVGRGGDVKFLVVSSDVIYPAGAMTDYEPNFYLPFKGFRKPIYAIPGNHDWFDALEGFNANFLEPKAARAALSARVVADLHLTSTNRRRIDDLLEQAARLRSLYEIDNAAQRAPFFEIQTEHFALIAIDTGITRGVDDFQLAWLERALARAKGKFTMAIVGHPRFAGGADTTPGDERFSALYRLLSSHGVRVAMAGDTHDFEYYAEVIPDGRANRSLHHFVNGGGGAYLSIGTALAWPQAPATVAWAFYPDTQSVLAKLDAETPAWKLPFWLWVRRFGAWPLSPETLSGMFDFNHAPFFQSFMEVRVEASRSRVVFCLHGVNGPVKWRELHTSGVPIPGQGRPEDAVQFVVPFREDAEPR